MIQIDILLQIFIVDFYNFSVKDSLIILENAGKLKN